MARWLAIGLFGPGTLTWAARTEQLGEELLRDGVSFLQIRGESADNEEEKKCESAWAKGAVANDFTPEVAKRFCWQEGRDKDIVEVSRTSTRSHTSFGHTEGTPEKQPPTFGIVCERARNWRPAGATQGALLAPCELWKAKANCQKCVTRCDGRDPGDVCCQKCSPQMPASTKAQPPPSGEQQQQTLIRQKPIQPLPAAGAAAKQQSQTLQRAVPSQQQQQDQSKSKCCLCPRDQTVFSLSGECTLCTPVSEKSKEKRLRLLIKSDPPAKCNEAGIRPDLCVAMCHFKLIDHIMEPGSDLEGKLTPTQKDNLAYGPVVSLVPQPVVSLVPQSTINGWKEYEEVLASCAQDKSWMKSLWNLVSASQEQRDAVKDTFLALAQQPRIQEVLVKTLPKHDIADVKTALYKLMHEGLDEEVQKAFLEDPDDFITSSRPTELVVILLCILVPLAGLGCVCCIVLSNPRRWIPARLRAFLYKKETKVVHDDSRKGRCHGRGDRAAVARAKVVPSPRAKVVPSPRTAGRRAKAGYEDDAYREPPRQPRDAVSSSPCSSQVLPSGIATRQLSEGGSEAVSQPGSIYHYSDVDWHEDNTLETARTESSSTSKGQATRSSLELAIAMFDYDQIPHFVKRDRPSGFGAHVDDEQVGHQSSQGGLMHPPATTQPHEGEQAAPRLFKRATPPFIPKSVLKRPTPPTTPSSSQAGAGPSGTHSAPQSARPSVMVTSRVAVHSGAHSAPQSPRHSGAVAALAQANGTFSSAPGTPQTVGFSQTAPAQTADWMPGSTPQAAATASTSQQQSANSRHAAAVSPAQRGFAQAVAREACTGTVSSLPQPARARGPSDESGDGLLMRRYHSGPTPVRVPARSGCGTPTLGADSCGQGDWTPTRSVRFAMDFELVADQSPDPEES